MKAIPILVRWPILDSRRLSFLFETGVVGKCGPNARWAAIEEVGRVRGTTHARIGTRTSKRLLGRVHVTFLLGGSHFPSTTFHGNSVDRSLCSHARIVVGT